ncbi:hypothetical protein [Niallia endozanthoxylica]|uniref:Uncharacterized protein n=1 Tax=Niallia endozanthoxylica TaxID=2036016 RepID=A0A5J5H679_9BACI|nr:hypothetical protein [Niallia endozanthoxylica]KAA9014914.1 hypothetical protein F4V44_23240 [Niallia endozanthoxylica]
MGLEEIFNWVKEQAGYVLMIVLIVVVLVTAAKRAWIAMLGAVIGIAFVGIFIVNPNVIVNLSEWFGEKLKLGA